MSIAEKLRKIGHKEAGVRHFCLETIRFKKLLENARGVLDLFADGREKMQGEYIFDRHYVVSLIDGVLDRLGMMVYDAGVLVPDNGEPLYTVFDTHKQTARNLIDTNAAGFSKAADFDDPEYRLLAAAEEWFNGKDKKNDETVMGFIKQTFYSVVSGLEPEAFLGRLAEKKELLMTETGLYVIDLWKDARGLPESKRTPADFNSIPLRHLLMDTPSFPAEPAWIAAVSEYQMSLQSLKKDCRFRLETLASGYEPSDFIFVFTDKAAIFDSMLPPVFHIETTAFGQFAWSLGLSANTIEDTLMVIGKKLFDESLWRL